MNAQGVLWSMEQGLGTTAQLIITNQLSFEKLNVKRKEIFHPN